MQGWLRRDHIPDNFNIYLLLIFKRSCIFLFNQDIRGIRGLLDPNIGILLVLWDRFHFQCLRSPLNRDWNTMPLSSLHSTTNGNETRTCFFSR